MTLQSSEAINGFIQFKRHNQGCSESTTTKYYNILVMLESFLDGLSSLKASYEQLAEFTGLHLHKKGLTPRSRKVYVSCIRGFYRWLFQSGQIPINPTVKLLPPKAGYRLPEGMLPSQIEQLLMAPGVSSFLGLRDTAIIMLLFGAGLRISEIRHLNQEDLIFEVNKTTGIEYLTLHIRSGKGDKDRFIPVPDICIYAVRALLGHKEMLPGSIDRLLPKGDHVLFVSTNNNNVPKDQYFGESRRLSSAAIYVIVKKYSDQCGIPKRISHPHALRHSYATQLIESGADVIHVQENLGHKSLQTTQIYIQLALKKRREVINNHSPFRDVQTPFDELRAHIQREAELK